VCGNEQIGPPFASIMVHALAPCRRAGIERNILHNILERKEIMLYTIAVVLLILWLLGVVTSYTIGGFIHILLVIAIIMILLRLISGRGV